MSILKINSNSKSIWRYADHYPNMDEKLRLTLGEGWTREMEIPSIAESLGISSVFFKREDENPNGSHKDRGLAYQISKAKEKGEKRLLVSSSGNAAISAAAYCRAAGIELFVFVSSKIDKGKLAAIAKNEPAAIIISEKPLTFAEYASKKFNIRNIRSTADENSVFGYRSLGFEIFEHLGELDSIFIAVSSGSTLLGIASAYRDLVNEKIVKKMPQLHFVQTSRIHPLAKHFDKDFKFEKEVLARAIVARDVPKEKEILDAVSASGGSGWIVQNEGILKASKILRENDVTTSYEGAAALAGIYKAKAKDFDIGQKVVCILTGKAYETDIKGAIVSDKIFHIESESELGKIINLN